MEGARRIRRVFFTSGLAIAFPMGEMNLPQASWDDVERVVLREFAPEQRDAVIALLKGYGGQEPNRVSLAILKLSRGNVEAVRYNVKFANEDFRARLMVAEYPRASCDWDSPMTEQRIAEDWREYQEWLHRE